MRVIWGNELTYFLERQPQRASQDKIELRYIAVRRSVLNFVAADERKEDLFHKAVYASRDDTNSQITKNNKFLSWVSQSQALWRTVTLKSKIHFLYIPADFKDYLLNFQLHH